jgi:hypothetical protein
MRAINIPRVRNDLQYKNGNTKDGMLIDKKTFFSFIKGLIEDYAVQDKWNIKLSVHDLPWDIQHQFLKQYLFYEGYLDYYEEICSNPHRINAAIQEELEQLYFWLEVVLDIEQKRLHQEYMDYDDLIVAYHNDGDPFITRKYY